MRIDPRKLFPNGMVELGDSDYISQLLLSSDQMEEVLEEIEVLNVRWSTNVLPTAFNPITEEPNAPYFCLEFYFVRNSVEAPVRVCYEAYDETPTNDHGSNRFWLEEVLSDELIHPTPLNLELLLDTEVFK